ncbi:MAG: DUF4377 domain-containing protein [Gemmatimonadaceae bacterium]
MHKTRCANPKIFHALALSLVVALAACGSIVGTERIVQTIEVGPDKVPCFTNSTQECLQVRVPGTTTWEYFSGEIEGFTFERGFLYVIRVERTNIQDPPPNGSAFRFRLVEILSKTAVTP